MTTLTPTVQNAVLQSQLDAARDCLKAAQSEADGRDLKIRQLAERVADLTALVRRMDGNRETLGDACRVCRERVWSGPGGARTPNHAEGCEVARAMAARPAGQGAGKGVGS